MGVHDGLGNGQPQAEAAAVGAGFVGAVKAIEDVGQLVRRDVLAPVRDSEHGAAALPRGVQLDGRAGRSVLHGVVQQHCQRLPQPGAVAPNGQSGGDVVLQQMPGFKGHRLEPQGGGDSHLGHVRRGIRQGARALLGAEQGEHVLHQRAHAAALRLNVVDIRLLLRRGAAPQQIRRGQDHRQGRFQLMAGVGQELLLLRPRRSHRLCHHAGQQIAAQEQHHQRHASHQRAGAQQRPQGRVFQIGVGKGDGGGGIARLPQVAQVVFVQRAGIRRPVQGGGDDVRQPRLVAEIIVAVARHADGAAAVDLRHEAGDAVHPRLADAVVPLLQRLIQLLLHVLPVVVPGDEEHGGEHHQQHQRDQQHVGGHHLPAEMADHDSTSRQ